MDQQQQQQQNKKKALKSANPKLTKVYLYL